MLDGCNEFLLSDPATVVTSLDRHVHVLTETVDAATGFVNESIGSISRVIVEFMLNLCGARSCRLVSAVIV